jgi:hypothetical protein
MTIDIGVTAQQRLQQPAQITGGVVESSVESGETYKTHTFATSGELVVVEPTAVDILVVAGGGGGGSDNGGGGGGGGVIYRTGYSQLTPGTYSVLVGAGGAGAPATAGQTTGVPGSSGTNSEVALVLDDEVSLETKLLTFGGGGGNSGHATTSSRTGGLAGGSGGGGAGEAPWITATTYNMNIGGESLQSAKTGAIAYSFNAESRLVIANNSLFDFDTNIDYTIETWFYIEGNSPLNASSLRRACIISAIGEAATTTTSYEFLINGTSTVTGTGFVINIRNTSTTPTIYTFPVTIPQREWHHVAFSKSSDVMSVYLNGVKIGEASDFTLKTTPGSNPIKIASVFATGTTFQPLIGKYSNLRVSRGLARYTGVDFTLPTEPYVDDQFTLLLTCQGENYKDASSNQFSITREGAVTINSSNTPFAKKTQFSGVFRNSAYLRADFALARFTTAAQPWTMECWLNEAPQAAFAYFIGINTIAAGGNVLLVRKDAVVVGATTYTFSSAFETGQWNHFAMTYSGTVLTVYKNGQEVLNQTVSMPSALYLSNFGIATEFDDDDGGTPGDYYTGYIHDFRVVNSVVYTENFTPPTELLEDILGTTLLCLRNNTFTDDSSNKTLITLFNNPLTENISPYAVDEFVPVTRTSAVLDPAFGSVTFNGSTDYIDVASNFTIGTGDFTIEFWCNFTVFTADTASRRILSQGANAADRVQIYIPESNRTINGVTAIRGSISLFTTADQISTVMAVNDGKWHHVAFTRSSGTLRSFVDGVLMDTRTGFTTNLFSPLGYRIGTLASLATSANYSGSLANIRISAPKAWYTENFTPTQDNFFIDYLDFDFITEVKLLIQGPELFDISNNFYTTTPAGTVATSEDSPFLQTAVTVFAPVKRAIKSYGNRGGNTITGTTQLGGGGGGGAGEPGANTNTSIGGAGGDGIYATAFDAYYGGGGGGGNTTDVTDVVAGGQGGGGAGGGSAVEGYHSATANTGGGGGGSYSIALPTFFAGGNGGSGVVKIKYKSNRPTAIKNGDIIFPIYKELSNGFPVSAVGPAESYTYFIDPQLPAGLTFDSATGLINGSSLYTVDNIFTVTVADTEFPSLRDSATFRLIITAAIQAVGGQQLTVIEEDQVYQVHKLTQSDFITVDNPGAIEYYIIGGGGAGGGGTGTADGSGGGGAGGYMVGTKTVTEDEFVSTVIYADSDFQDQGWTEGSDFTGTTGVIEFEKTITSLDNQIFAGGARSNALYQSIKSYLEIQINEYDNVNVGLCRSSSAGGFANIPSINLDTGVVGYRLEFKDNSVNNLSITKNGDVVFSEISPFESAVGSAFFDGVGDYLLSPPNLNFSFSTGDFTVEAWVNFSALAANRMIVDCWIGGGSPQGGAGSWQLYYTNTTGKIAWYAGTSTIVSSTTTPIINTWYHVAVARAGSTVKIFINGVEEASAAHTTDLTHSRPLAVGVQYSTTTNFFSGYISNIRIVKGTAVYTGNFTPPSEPLTEVAGTSLLTLQGPNFVPTSESLSAFRPSDILQILYDSLNNKVYFGKNNTWSKNYLSPADGDVIPDSGPLQVIVMANGPIDSTATMSAVFLRKENYRYPPPAGYTALGDEIAIFPVVIGAGGAGSTSTSGGNGGDTILFGVTALGGGGGASFDLVGNAGGSGGGAGGRNTRAGGAALQLALGGFGSVGGTSSPSTAGGSNAGGGGGGIPQINITRASGTLVGLGGDILDFEQDGVFYRTHVFKSTSAFYVTSDRDIEYLVVAGGGGGGYGRTGNHVGGGGGAGGLLYNTSRAVVGTTYVITVGAGGTAFANGTNSSIIGDLLSVTTTGGGAGGGGGGANGFLGGINPTPGSNGGSGGGGSGNQAGGTGIPGQGNNGAIGGTDIGGGGGGGGAGAQGIRRESGGGGGIGRQFDITGADTYYAGGGGYGANSPGGLGGGGKGAKDNGTTDPADLAASGEANTGGGGGGGAPPNGIIGGTGGSGVVVIRYQISAAEKLNNTDYISAGILSSSPGQNAALAAGGSGGTGITLFDGEIYGSGGGASGDTTSGLGGSIYAGEGALSAGLVGASSGLANTGSGGGGSWRATTNGGLGGAGGSGVAFIRYRTQ